MEKTAGQLFLDLPKRFLGLLNKLLSMKTLVFAVATVLMVKSSLPYWVWLIVAVMVILGREADKHLPALFEKLVGCNVDKD